MKQVSVLTIEDVEIKRWRWYSNWIDIAVFDYQSRPWLVQMRVSRMNGKQFRSISITGIWYKQTTAAQIGDLVQLPGVSKPNTVVGV